MVVYEVTARVDDTLREDYERYMRGEHIPAVLATGCFRSASFERTLGGTYRMCYRAASQAALDVYLRDHTTGLRAGFAQRFPAGVSLSREIWTQLEDWSCPA